MALLKVRQLFLIRQPRACFRQQNRNNAVRLIGLNYAESFLFLKHYFGCLWVVQDHMAFLHLLFFSPLPPHLGYSLGEKIVSFGSQLWKLSLRNQDLQRKSRSHLVRYHPRTPQILRRDAAAASDVSRQCASRALLRESRHLWAYCTPTTTKPAISNEQRWRGNSGSSPQHHFQGPVSESSRLIPNHSTKTSLQRCTKV